MPTNDYAYRDKKGQISRVGNSVSIRSKRLLEYPALHNLKWEKGFDDFYNEDIFLCCLAKNEMEEHGLRWAPLDVAVKFGREHMIPENKGVEPFAFHKWRGENFFCFYVIETSVNKCHCVHWIHLREDKPDSEHLRHSG